MRIVFGHQRFGVQPFGGISRYCFNLARALGRIPGVHASVFAPFHVNHYLAGSGIVEPWGLRLPAFPGSGFPLGIVDAWLSRWMLRGEPAIDVYHESYYARADAAPKGAIRMLTVHDMIHELFPGSFPAFDRTSQVKKQAIARADHLICGSESTRLDVIRMLDVPPERISVVYHGNSLETPPDIEPPRSVGRPFLLYVGARSGYKNFEGFLRAYASSPALKQDFRVVCFGGGKLTPREFDLCRSLGLSESQVESQGGSDRELILAYLGATMLVYPSLYEGFGFPPLEAMSLGCPVVCADSSSIPEVVGDAGRYFDPASVEDIRSAIEEVAGSVQDQQALRQSGRRQAARFTWDRCAAQTLDVYRAARGDRVDATPVP